MPARSSRADARTVTAWPRAERRDAAGRAEATFRVWAFASISIFLDPRRVRVQERRSSQTTLSDEGLSDEGVRLLSVAASGLEGADTQRAAAAPPSTSLYARAPQGSRGEASNPHPPSCCRRSDVNAPRGRPPPRRQDRLRDVPGLRRGERSLRRVQLRARGWREIRQATHLLKTQEQTDTAAIISPPTRRQFRTQDRLRGGLT